MKRASQRLTVFFTGGGTGGHVFPLLAVAEALRGLAPEAELVFVGAERGMERRVVPAAGYPLELLDARPFLGGGPFGAARGLMSVASALPRCRALLRQHAPGVVFATGGYAAVPMAFAAQLARVPLALMESNHVPGLANRALAPLSARIYTSFEETRAYFPAARVMRTGMALRAGFDRNDYAPPGDGVPLRVLILGGSQGARSLNQATLDAIGRLRSSVTVVHQVGASNLPGMRASYASRGRESVRVVGFIEEMPSALASADLVVSRAGMGAITEICAVGRPSLLAPLPGHQLQNARALEREGAARCIPSDELEGAALASAIDELAADPVRLRTMAERAADWGRPQAAGVVARDLMAQAGISCPTDAAQPGTESRLTGPGAN